MKVMIQQHKCEKYVKIKKGIDKLKTTYYNSSYITQVIIRRQLNAKGKNNT